MWFAQSRLSEFYRSRLTQDDQNDPYLRYSAIHVTAAKIPLNHHVISSMSIERQNTFEELCTRKKYRG